MEIIKVVLTVITSFSLLFNFVALYFLCKHSRKNNYVFLCINLSLCDLLQTLLGYAPSLFLERNMKNATRLCKITAFFVAFPSFASISLLASIAFTRVYSLKEAFLTSGVVCRKQIKIIISVSMVYGLFWSTLPLLGISSYALESTRSRCSIKWHIENNKEKIYLILLIVFCYAIPVLTITMSSLVTAGTVHKKLENISHSLYLNKSAIKLCKLRERKVKLSLTLMCLSFVICWAPYAIIGLLSAFTKLTHPNWLLETAALFAKSSAMINPLLYWQKDKLKTFLSKQMIKICIWIQKFQTG